jgi:superfamily II DNA or RNA helicase
MQVHPTYKEDEDIAQTTNSLSGKETYSGMFDCPDASVAIILGFDSSETKSTQRRGRVVRKFEDKVAEIFYIVINNTQETKWFKDSHQKTDNYITIDEKGLEQVLRGEVPDVVKHKPKELMFRF